MMKYVDLDMVYPVGSIYFSANATNPGQFFGGTWRQIEDRFLLCAGSTYQAGTTGGAATVALAKTQVPKTSGYFYMHAQAVATNIHAVGGCFSSGIINENTYRDGGDTIKQNAPSIGRVDFDNGGLNEAHNNMPPYSAVYVFQRNA